MIENMDEKIMGLVELRCGCRYVCIERQLTDRLLGTGTGHNNQVTIKCEGCVSLEMRKIVVFNPDLA